MRIDSTHLYAFYLVATNQSFSKASKGLGLSQPALSIRIRNLEESLGTSLFIRGISSITLTDSGQKLFLYAKLSLGLEEQVLQDIKASRAPGLQFQGLIRIAGFSTVINSVLVPALSELTRQYPHLQFEIMTREMHELINCLKRSEADFVFLEGSSETQVIESIHVGYEENVLVESKRIEKEKRDVYIDNDPDDNSTINFFKEQKDPPKKYKRWYLDTASTLLEAVKEGWGRAVHPRHIVDRMTELHIVTKYKAVKTPIFLHFYRQPYYSKVQILVRNHLVKEFRERLSK